MRSPVLLEQHPKDKKKSSSNSTSQIDHCLLFSLLWSFGAILNAQNKIAFEKWLKNKFHFLEFFHSTNDTKPAALWECLLDPKSLKLTQIAIESCYITDGDLWKFVDTPKTVALAKVIKILLHGGIPVVLDGATGSGKTSFLLNMLKNCYSNDIPDSNWVHMLMDREVDSTRFWDQLKDKIRWNSGNNYTPAECQELVCFVDDIHLTQV